MEDQRNVKWILIISIIMFFASIGYALPYSYPGSQRSIWDTISYLISRIDTLLFIITITTGTLFTTGFGKKERMHRFTVYFFIISMVMFFIGFLRWLFAFP